MPDRGRMAIDEGGARRRLRRRVCKARPDEVGDRGDTWTPTTRDEDPKDRHDRIDFVFAGGSGVTVKSAEIVGKPRGARRGRHAVPVDHRGVVAAFEPPRNDATALLHDSARRPRERFVAASHRGPGAGPVPRPSDDGAPRMADDDRRLPQGTRPRDRAEAQRGRRKDVVRAAAHAGKLGDIEGDADDSPRSMRA